MLATQALQQAAATADVTLLHPLGRGGQGQVWCVNHPRPGACVAERSAFKVVPRRTRAQRAAFERELGVGQALRSRHVVRTHGGWRGSGWGALRMDYVEGINLAVLCRLFAATEPGPWPTEAVVAVIRPLLSALRVMHGGAPGWIHGDVTPDNLVVPRNGQARLLDFGAARRVGQRVNQGLGKARYLPPRWRSEHPASTAADMFGVGAILFELLTGSVFPADRAPQPPSGPPISGSGSDGSRLWRLTQALLATNPRDRPGAAEASQALPPLSIRGPEQLAGRVARCLGPPRSLAPSSSPRPPAPSRPRRWAASAAALWLVVEGWLSLGA